MKIYVGVKKSDHNFLSKNLDKTVNYIIWPDSFKKIKDSVFLTIKEKKIVNSCYIHYSGYQKLSSEDLETFENRCINLHPALPKYPGVGGINRALYEEEATFGITVHLMNNRIDNGRILEVITFPINKFKFLDEAIYILNNKRLELIKKIIEEIELKGFDKFCDKFENNNYVWSSKVWLRKDLNFMQTLKIDELDFMSELRKRLRAYHKDDFPLKLKFGGCTFSITKIYNG